MVQKSGDHQLIWVVYPIICRVLYIPGGCLGFLPSTVSSKHSNKEKQCIRDGLLMLVVFCFRGEEIETQYLHSLGW